jgi:integrase/recombinase XerD
MNAPETSRERSLPAGLARPLERFLAAMEQGKSANTLDAYRRDLGRYVRSLAQAGVERVEQVQQAHITSLLHELHDSRLSPSTLARNLTSIKRFHHFLVVQGSVEHNPAENLEAPRPGRQLPEVLSVAEIAALVEAPDVDAPLGLRDRAILELLYATGMRVSELTGLRRGALLFSSGLVRLLGRGLRERLVPVGRQAVHWVETYLRDSRPRLARPDSGDAVFLNAQGSPLSRMGIWKIIRGACEKAGIHKPVSPHTLRHSFAAHLLEGGASLRDVQEMMGHADLATTQVYARMDRRHLKELHRAYHPRG